MLSRQLTKEFATELMANFCRHPSAIFILQYESVAVEIILHYLVTYSEQASKRTMTFLTGCNERGGN